MEQYFIIQGNREQGPFDMVALALKKIKGRYAGMVSWIKKVEQGI